MKKAFLFIAALFLVSRAVSQSDFGVKAGLNVAKQVITMTVPEIALTYRDSRPFVGYQVGFFYKTDINERLLFAAEPGFSVVYHSEHVPGAYDVVSTNTYEKLGFIQLPLT